jgi:hypothetical protein
MRSAQTVSMMACWWWNMSTLAAEDSSAEVINGGDSFHLHETRQGSPPFNPAQDQLGRDGMVGGEDALADFCEFGMRSTHRASGSSTAPG